jgi:hypothetical protein
MYLSCGIKIYKDFLFMFQNLDHIVAKKEFIPPLEISTNKKGGFVIRSGQLC